MSGEANLSNGAVKMEVSLFDTPSDEETEVPVKAESPKPKPKPASADSVFDSQKDKDTPEEEEHKPIPLNEMSVEELQAELQRRNVVESSSSETSTTSGGKWVTIMDSEKDGKLLRELKKLGKLDCFGSRSKDISKAQAEHRVRVFPLTLSEIEDPVFVDLMNKSYNVSIGTRMKDRKVMCVVTLLVKKVSVIKEMLPLLTDFNSDLKVVSDIEGANTKSAEWKKIWDDMCMPPDDGPDTKITMYLPSLPQTITHDVAWDLFPSASGITVIDAEPRKHAFVSFSNVDACRAAVNEANRNGPPRGDLPFCGMLSFTRMNDLYKDVKMASLAKSRAAKKLLKKTEAKNLSGQPQTTPKAAGTSKMGSKTSKKQIAEEIRKKALQKQRNNRRGRNQQGGRGNQQGDRGNQQGDRGNQQGDRGNQQGGRGNQQGGRGNKQGGRSNQQGGRANQGGRDNQPAPNQPGSGKKASRGRGRGSGRGGTPAAYQQAFVPGGLQQGSRTMKRRTVSPSTSVEVTKKKKKRSRSAGQGGYAPQGHMQGPYGQPQGYNQVPPQGFNQGPPQGFNQGPPPGFNRGPPQEFNQGPPQNYNPGMDQGYGPSQDFDDGFEFRAPGPVTPTRGLSRSGMTPRQTPPGRSRSQNPSPSPREGRSPYYPREGRSPNMGRQFDDDFPPPQQYGGVSVLNRRAPAGDNKLMTAMETLSKLTRLRSLSHRERSPDFPGSGGFF